MQNRGMVFIALLIILAGVLLLLGNLFNLDIGTFCWPLGLILLGAFLIFRPRMAGPDTNTHMTFIGDIRRNGPGELEQEEIWGFITDVEYDLTKYDIPPGETIISNNSFIGDVEIFAPMDVGVYVSASAFFSELKVDGEKSADSFLSPVNYKTDGYKMAERRVRFELNHFIADVKLRRF